MAGTKAFVGELVRPKAVRWGALLLAGVGAYDVGCNQFGWPKIPELWGMTGSLLPWWGWLIAIQGLIVVALFEYVRRNATQALKSTPPYDESKLRQEVSDLAETVRAVIVDYQNMRGYEAGFSGKLDRLKIELSSELQSVRAGANMTAGSITDMLQSIEKMDKTLAGWSQTLAGVKKLRYVADHYIGRLRAVVWDEIWQAIDAMDSVTTIGRDHARDLHISTIQDKLALLGRDMSSGNGYTYEQRLEEINTQNQYVVLLEGEEDRWKSGAEKKQYYLDRAFTDAFKSNYQRAYVPPGDIELLRVWRT
ncbi:hypothetical protein [Sphingopyxis sp. R3-92]|uniref:hypothetical protein n=1 Tax=Sphingopyxis sp. R3-92 TaxID=3158553 RepID=UPI003EE59993